jgi:adenosylmethionine-8-amino-7-oxononanoate aminotransferase
MDVNNRFAENLCAAKISTPLNDLIKTVTEAKYKNGQRIRVLDPVGKDKAILDAVSDPKFTIAGFSNKEIRKNIREQGLYKQKT